MFAQVAIDSGGDLVLDYRVPHEHAGKLAVGSLVSVPLGKRVANGIVLSLSAKPSTPGLAAEKVRPFYKLLFPTPVIDQNLVELGDWVASYYAAPRQVVLRLFVPAGVWKGGVRSAMTTWLLLSDGVSIDSLGRSPRQREIVLALEAAPSRELPLEKLPGKRSGTLSMARKMEKEGLLRVELRPSGDPLHGDDGIVSVEPPEPNAEQVVAIKRISELLQEDAPRPLLLFGVTGSGKTEVYIRAIDEVVERGRSALLLVPEIALTPQTMERMRARFEHTGKGVALLHSGLSEGERYGEWCRIVSGEARIVIGPRSAVFAPVRDLGIIVVDEEHEPSYKQDTSPRYHGRDVAVMRGKICGCPVILGSATPSLESLHNVHGDKYHLCRLEKRVDDCELPVVRVVDLRREPRPEGGAPAIFSVELARQIRLRLERREQVILFLNRRGYARSQQCLACGHAVGCPHCSMTLTYHRKREQLLCHICGHQQRPARACPECGDASIRASGFGTERVEAALDQQFPQARVARVDSDTVARKGRLQEVLDDFKTGRIDILVGTQMIAKGLHFPGVTLVGVLQADLGLQTPDFRAAERVFQLLTQVAGRAGRGDLAGEVVVQAFSPESPAIQFARHQDFDGFARQELEMRKAFGYPPYGHAALVLSRSEDAVTGHRVLLDLVPHFKAAGGEMGVLVGEAIPCPLEKAHGQFRFQILLRSVSPARIRKLIRDGLAAIAIPEEAVVVWDMDPYSLM